MKEIKISKGGSSGQGSLVLAILLVALGFHNLLEAGDRGRILDYLFSIIQMSFGGYFALDWYRYWSGYYKMAFDSDGYEIRVNGTVTAAGRFNELRDISQDGRGYTVTRSDGSQYRLLRKIMDIELQSTLDSIQQEAEQGGSGDAEEAV